MGLHMLQELELIKPVLIKEIEHNANNMTNERINILINLYLDMLNDEVESFDKLIIEFKAKEYASILLRRQNSHEAQ